MLRTTRVAVVLPDVLVIPPHLIASARAVAFALNEDAAAIAGGDLRTRARTTSAASVPLY